VTVTVTGPDNSTFEFPDGTPQETITSMLGQHYGAGPATPAVPKPSGEDVSAISAAEALPIVGAYSDKAAAWLRSKTRGGTTAENLAQIQGDVANYRRQHPIQSTAGDLAIGSLPYVALGGFGPAARALGMVGKASEAIPLAAGTGGLIGGLDAAARGEDPHTGAIVGALTGAGGVAAGKAVGRVWDAARGMFVDRPRIPNTIDVNGRPIPVSESTITRNPMTAAEEQGMLGTQVPAAVEAEGNTRAAMQQAHDDLNDRLRTPVGPIDPNAPPSATPQQAGGAAVGDLVAQEQQRTADEVARLAGLRTDTQTLTRDLGGGIAGPAQPQDVGTSIGQRIRDLFTTARQATRTAYRAAANLPASYNPRFMYNAGRIIRTALDTGPIESRVRINPATTPQAQAALDMIDQEIGQLRFTNAAGDRAEPGLPAPVRPITPADMEQIRKGLVIMRRQANNAARTSGNWEDARAIGRVIDGFDAWEQATATRPGGLLTGDPADVVATRQAARAAHAQERATFSRRGPGDVVGTFMENVVGKYPGQEMSPEKIVRSLLGAPGSAPPENAVPILNHLRDNVFGANSPEWASIKRSVVQHLTEAPAGAEPLSELRQAQQIERFLDNDRHAGALFDAGEQARLQQHADSLRAARDEPAARGTMAQRLDVLSGRITGEGGTPDMVISDLLGQRGGQLAAALRDRISPESWVQLKQGLLKKAIAGPDGAIPWGDQKIGNKIADFLTKDVVREMYSPQEIAMIKRLGDAHIQLIPPPRTTNPSGSGYELKRAAKTMFKTILATIGVTTHGLPGLAGAKAAGEAIDRYGAWQQGQRAKDLFQGYRTQLPRQGARIPPAFGALGGATLRPAITDQASQ
jgi:hypothetical protein